MLIKRNVYAYLLTIGVGVLAPLASYAQQCDQTFSPITIRQGQSYTISDSLTNSSSNPYVVEHFGIEYQGGPSQYVQGSTFTNQPFGSLANDIVDGGAVNRALGGVNGFVVTNAQSRDFLIRFKVTGYHISTSDACISNPSLPCTALSYGDHYECQPLVVTKCGDGEVDSQYGEQCDGGPNCNASCQTEDQPPRTYCGDGVIQSPNTDGQYEQCDRNDPNKTNWGNGGCSMSCEPIHNPEPPLHCEYYWNDWGACENGEQTRYPVITQQPANNGNACPEPEKRPCDTPQPDPYCNSLSVTPDNILVGQSVNYSCDGGNGSFEITGPDGFMSNSSNGSITINSIGTHTITCRVSGVTNGACQKAVTVTQPPSPQNSWKCTITNGNGHWVSVPYVSNAGQFNPNHIYAEHDQVNYSSQPPAQSCQGPQPQNSWQCQRTNDGQNGYWSTIAYNASYESFDAGKTYSVGNNVNHPTQPANQSCVVPPPQPTGVDVWTKKTVHKKTFTNATGEIITWTIEYGNRGPEATRMVIADVVPSELTYLPDSIDATKYTQSIQVNPNGTTTVTWTTVQVVQPGETGQIVIRTQYKGGYPANHTIRNTVCVDDVINKEPSDKEHDNCSNDTTKPEDPTTPKIDLQVTKKVDRASFPNQTGELVVWTLTYRNNGPATATNVTITDELPNYLAFVSSAPSPTRTGSIARTKPRTNVDSRVLSGGLEWNVGTLNPGQTGAIVITTRYLGGAANDIVLKNKVIIKGNQDEENYTNNEDEDVTKPYGSGSASLGDYVWIDSNKDGVQGSGELALSGVKVELYKLNVCSADLGTPLATTTTNGSGYYLFTGLDAGNYKVKFILANGYEFTLPNQGSDDSLDSDAGLNGVTNCIELKEGEHNMTVDAGVYMVQPVSCEGLVVTPGTVKVNQTVSYTCNHKNATSAIVTVTMSGSTGAVITLTGFTGQFNVSAAGDYFVQCTLDNGVDYKVSSFTASGSLDCAYKAQANNTNTCAVKSALDPYLTSGLNLSGLLYMPTPYPYCSDAQLADTSYQCVAAPSGSQILTRQDGVCRADLKVNSGGGTCTNCGGNSVCGNGVVETGEQCDDGNSNNDDGCSNVCTVRKPPTGGGGKPPVRPIEPGEGLTCEMLDPPAINKGEYMPFWWTFAKEDDVELVTSCSDTMTSQKTTYVLKDSAVCVFEIRDAEGKKVQEVTRNCFQKTRLTDYKLFDTFFSNPLNISSRNGYNIAMRSELGGSAWLSPSDFEGVTKYGEYTITLVDSHYRACEQVVDSAKRVSVRPSSVYYKSSIENTRHTQCQYNFTVTAPYFIQDGKALGTTNYDASIINNFYKIGVAGSIANNIVASTNYARSANLKNLTSNFVNKYTKLATQQVEANIYKVPGQDIYVAKNCRAVDIKGTSTVKGTLITNCDVNVIGNVSKVAMIIANGYNIHFVSTDELNNSKQIIKGIYIANTVSTDKKRNDNVNGTWVNDGRLLIEGVIITEQGSARDMANDRRSTLTNWFVNNSDTIVDYLAKQKEVIIDGAAFTVKTDPSFWTNLPPGANELMTALEVYK